MPIITDYINVNTEGNRDIVDLTPDLKKIISKHKISHAMISVFVPGSTAAITTIEFEPGLKKDIDIYLNKLIPYGEHYYHHETWNDDNGSSHLQAAIIGPSETIPLVEGSLMLGTWQQVIIVDCDTRPRERKVVVQMVY